MQLNNHLSVKEVLNTSNTQMTKTAENLNNPQPKEKLQGFKYDRPIEYWLIIVGYAIGYGSFWRFPYLIYSCGGGVFFIPFLIFFFSIGIPLFTLETILGQVFKKGTVEVFVMIRKKFTGVGWASVIISWIMSLYYSIIMCWSLYYFFLSFINPLPWSREANMNVMNNNQNGTNLSETNNTNFINNNLSNNQSSKKNPEQEYINLEFFSKQVLKLSIGIDNMGSIDFNMALCLMITYVMIFFCISKGIKSSTKVVYFTAPAPVILLVILFIKALTLPGIGIGLKFLLLPDVSRLFHLDVWIKACNQAIFMLTVGVGGNILFASYRKDNEDVYQSSLWIPVMTLCFGVFCAVINFSYLGHFSYMIGVPIEELPLTGTGLAFVTYPSALCMFPFANLWSLLFFLMLITLGIDSQFAFIDLVSHYIYETFLHKLLTRTQTSILICVIGFIMGLPFITNGGFFLLELVDNYATLISCFLISLLQAYSVSKYIGVNVISEIVTQKTGKIIPNYIFFSIQYLCPIVHIVLILASIDKAINEKVNYKVMWPHLIQWVIILWPVVVIFYYIIKHKDEEDKGVQIFKFIDNNQYQYEEEMKVIPSNR